MNVSLRASFIVMPSVSLGIGSVCKHVFLQHEITLVA